MLDATRAGRLRGLVPALALFALGGFLVAGLPWWCPLLALTGIPCPTCGITRATRLALHGDFAGATRMHPLWFVVVPTCAAIGVAEAALYWKTGRWGGVIERTWVKRWLGVVLAGLLAAWAGRLLLLHLSA